MATSLAGKRTIFLLISWLTHPNPLGFIESLVTASRSLKDAKEVFPRSCCARMETQLGCIDALPGDSDRFGGASGAECLTLN